MNFRLARDHVVLLETAANESLRRRKACELFLCFVAIVRVRVYYVDFFVFFVLRHW